MWSMTCSGWFADFNWRFCSMQYLTVIQFTTLYIRGANRCPCTHLPVLLVAAAINNFRQATCSSGLADLLSGYPKVGTVVWLSYSLALASGLAEDGCCMLVGTACSSWAYYCCCCYGSRRQSRGLQRVAKGGSGVILSTVQVAAARAAVRQQRRRAVGHDCIAAHSWRR